MLHQADPGSDLPAAALGQAQRFCSQRRAENDRAVGLFDHPVYRQQHIRDRFGPEHRGKPRVQPQLSLPPVPGKDGDYPAGVCQNEKDRGKLGLVNITENYEIYALTWDDVFKSFEISHSFCLDKLKLDRDEIISKIKLSSEEKSKETVDKLTNAITSNSED